MDVINENDIVPAPLEGRRIAIIGYGNQGRAQALNLRDGGYDVAIGLRAGSGTREKVEQDGLDALPLEDAVRGAALTMMLVPDEAMAATYAAIEPALDEGSALGFSHGLAIQFGHVDPRPDLDVVMISPKGPGSALRTLFESGGGMPALVAVHRDASGQADALTLAYGRAIGCARAGLIRSSFEEEAVCDLFNEQAVVWGGVPALLLAGYETLVEAGYSPEVAAMECIGELSLLADLVAREGIAGMRERISNTAELGAALGGPAIADHQVRQRMRDLLEDVQSGRFAAMLSEEAASDYPVLKKARREAAAHPSEAILAKLARLSPNK